MEGPDTTVSPGKPEHSELSSPSNQRTAPIIVLHRDTGGSFDVKCLPRNPKRVKGLWVRNSLRWADCYKVPSGPYYIPFIDKLGRITGHTLYKWACDPRQAVASVVSTVSHRIQVYARRHNDSKTVNKYSHFMMRGCVYYCMSKNSWFWDRFLFFLRDLMKHGKRILTLVLKFVSKENDYKRFVYSQVCSQTHWLLFRAKRPRDKFAFITGRGEQNLRNFSVSAPLAEWRYGICDFARAITQVGYRW
jgi:hypothetical protein